MSELADSLKAALTLGNEMYAQGYKEGVIAGKREAYAEMKAILERVPEQVADQPSAE